MTDVHDPASLLEAAERAVADGDYLTAERLLRDAAASQESTHGTRHADLAATLNNLAFVCEHASKLEEAERLYRRAHAIAVASLGPGHPFIGTSLRNLVAFCSAHGIPIWKPPAAVVDDELTADAEADAAGDDAVEVLSELEAEAEARAEADDEPSDVGREAGPTQPADRGVPVTLAASVLGVAAIAVIALVVWRGTTTGTVIPAPDVIPSVEGERPAPAAASLPAPTREPGPPPPPGPIVAAAQVTVLRAQLCSALEQNGSPDWRCTPASGELEPGAYTFYTRLLTDAETTVEHRWYRGDRLHQVVQLRVAPSPGRGYRTFSRNTVSPEGPGDWKVELRAADGTLLREERFVVR